MPLSARTPLPIEELKRILEIAQEREAKQRNEIKKIQEGDSTKADYAAKLDLAFKKLGSLMDDVSDAQKKLTQAFERKQAELTQAIEDDKEETRRKIADLEAAATAAVATPAVTTAVQGSQLTILPQFDGEKPEETEGWIELAERAQIQFNWSDAQLANVVKNKLTGAAGIWLRSLDKLNPGKYITWRFGQSPFKPVFQERFVSARTDQAAIQAVSHLQQKANETCAQFFDRVVLALDKVNHQIPDDLKMTNAYQANYQSQIKTFFGAGLKEEVKRAVLGGNQPPETMNELRTQAINTELQLQKRGREVLALEKEEEETPKEESGGSTEMNDLTQQVKDLTKSVEALKVQKKNQGGKQNNHSHLRCYKCQKMGHISRNCNVKGNNNNNNNWRGRGGGRGRGRGGYNNYNNNNNWNRQGPPPQWQQPQQQNWQPWGNRQYQANEMEQFPNQWQGNYNGM